MAIVVLNEKNFASEVLQSEIPVLVDFWATWCGPCRMQAPVIDEMASEITGVKFAKLDVDENTDLAVRYGVSSIPTLIVFQDGQPINSVVGLQSRKGVERLLGL